MNRFTTPPSAPPTTIDSGQAIVMAQDFATANPQGIISIAGPTASGKTGFSIALAQSLGKAEVISVDSRQIYRDLDISSAAILPDEMAGIPHHGLRMLDPTQSFNSYDFQQYAYQKIDEIHARGNTPILVGGTMLWLDAITQGLMFGQGPDKPKYTSLSFSIHRDRAELYDRIDLRTQIMYDNGLIDEVKTLKAKYTSGGLHHNVATSIGVAEASAYLAGLCTLEESMRTTSKRTRKYAKRQLTWWRGRQDVTWVQV